jgi:glyoxylase-like metal-dependent hydrolase (beta-lactamase superfamily II)
MQNVVPPQSRRREEPLPEAREVAPNVWKITVPIPFPLRFVNIHALVGKDGWAIVDTGMGNPDARVAFAAGLQRAGLDIHDLRAIVLTHHHPDHVGLSGELFEQSRAPVYMHPIDAEAIQILWNNSLPQRFGRVSQFFLQHGLPPTQLWYTHVEPQQARTIINVPPPAAVTPVEDGEMLELVGEVYRVIWVPGHSDGQIVLFRERDGLFLAADHVLPRITPNVGLYSEKDRPNPLGDYLESLAKVAALPASLVLPGHGEPFTDLAGRTAEITQHHHEREEQLLAMLRERPQHAYELAVQLFQDRLKSDEARRMGVAEVIAHLEHMRLAGRLTQQRTDEGIILYVPV